jgi:hypothetical protein
MSTFDLAIHIVGILLLISLGVLSLWIECKRLKRMVAGVFVLVLSLLLADAAMHLLPNAIADFIYGTHKHYVPRNFLRD